MEKKFSLKFTLKFNPFLFLLGLILCMLKLAGTIAWSWWWVTLPIYGPIAIWAVIMLGIAALVGTRKGADAIAEQTFEPEGQDE